MSFKSLRPLVFWLPLAVFAGLVVMSLFGAETFLSVTTAINDWILAVFSNAFAWGAFLFVLTCLWAAFSPLGRVRIGGPDAKPILPRWNWLSITLTTTIAIGILFWATAEPIYHLYNPGGLDLAPGGERAERFSMVSLFMHWAFTPYAIYTVPGLTFALAYYNFSKPFSLASPIAVMAGRNVPRIGASLLDALALLALLFGLAASLGAGIMSISGGIDRLTPLTSNSVMLACVALGIVAAFSVSSASGLQRGIKVLADINTRIFLALLLFVLITGPTLQILSLGAQSFGQYLAEFVPRSLILSPFDDREWMNAWTVFYFANWLAWAPLTAMFLAKISKGYTVREYILMNFFLPAMFSVVWMSVFGGLSLQVESANPGLLQTTLENMGPEHVLYAVTNILPLSVLIAGLLVVITFLSYVTAADSNTDVLASLTIKNYSPKTPRRQTISVKLIWAGTVGLAAWVMVTASGIDGVKMLSNLGGLPALFIVLTFNAALIMMGTVRLDEIREVG